MINPFRKKKRLFTGTVGLVLGSGSARGWAHIVVIRALTEAGIHVDYIAGTSIGALVGAVYALEKKNGLLSVQKSKILEALNNRIGRAYRHIQRYRQILTVLFKYGFGDVVDILKIEQYLEIGLQMVSRKRREKIETLSRAERVRMVLEELDPTFIKMGQILSTRSDLIQVEFIKELPKLQDEVPLFPFFRRKGNYRKGARLWSGGCIYGALCQAIHQGSDSLCPKSFSRSYENTGSYHGIGLILIMKQIFGQHVVKGQVVEKLDMVDTGFHRPSFRG